MTYQPPIPGGGTGVPAPRAVIEEILEPLEDLPFIALVTLPGGERIHATAYPCQRIVHAFPYLLRDGRVILGERLLGLRINDGYGWRVPESEPDVIGRIAVLHRRNGEQDWSEESRSRMNFSASTLSGQGL